MAGNSFLEPLGQCEAILTTVKINLIRLADAAHALGQEPLAQKLYRDADRIGVANEHMQLGRYQALRMYVEGAESAGRAIIGTALAVAAKQSQS